MGCCQQNSDDCSAEERLIRNREAELGLGNFTCKELDLFIRKICSKSYLNAAQFQAFMEKLAERRGNLKRDTSVYCFFRSVVYYKGEYTRFLLLLLVVLYSRGSYPDKATILLEIVDTDLIRQITLADAQLLAHFMVEIALVSSFSAVYEENLHGERAKKLKEYKADLEQVKDKVEGALMKLLVGKSSHCRLEDLQRQVKYPDVGRLLTAVGLRDFACELIKDSKRGKR